MSRKSLYGDHSPVSGHIVAILHYSSENLALDLVEIRSRALLKHEIHELMQTDEKSGPGSHVERVSPYAFFEVEDGGLAVVGDVVYINDEAVGALTGFELNHMPNHMNLMIKASTLTPPNLQVGDRVIIKQKK